MSGVPDWFVAMCLAYGAALALWGLAIREANRSGGGFGLLLSGWVMWAAGITIFIAGSAA